MRTADWKLVAEMRLYALQECESVFGITLEEQKKLGEEDWKRWIEGEAKAVFGLFDGCAMIGLTGVIGDKEESGAGLMVASYIVPEYRRQGLSDFLYKARIDWAKNYRAWRKLNISHREGNEASRRANQRHGFVYKYRKEKTWPDGSIADQLCYELDLEKLRQNNDSTK